MAGQSNYSASKAGMIGLTKALAREVASRQVTVNALALGMVATDMSGTLDQNYRVKILEQIPLGRFAESDEVAPPDVEHGASSWASSQGMRELVPAPMLPPIR